MNEPPTLENRINLHGLDRLVSMRYNGEILQFQWSSTIEVPKDKERIFKEFMQSCYPRVDVTKEQDGIYTLQYEQH